MTSFLWQARAEEQGGYQLQPQMAMPNYLPLVVKAGDIALFDTSIWHTAGANVNGRDRENTIIRCMLRPADLI